MTMHAIRAVVQGGRLVPVDAAALPEGAEVLVVVDLPVAPPEVVAPRVEFSHWSLGVRQPLTREAIYDDAG